MLFEVLSLTKRNYNREMFISQELEIFSARGVCLVKLHLQQFFLCVYYAETIVLYVPNSTHCEAYTISGQVLYPCEVGERVEVCSITNSDPSP